jgi:hypothetical protein
MEQALNPVNFILIITGCRLYPSKAFFFNLIDDIQAFMLLVSHSVFIYGLTIYIEPTVKDTVDVTRLVIQQIIGQMFIVVVRTNRNKLRALMKSVEKALTPEDFKRLYNFGVWIGVPHWIFLVVMVGIKIQYFIQNEDTPFIGKIVVVHCELNSWIFGAVPLFLVCLLGIHASERNVIDNIAEDVTHNLGQIPPKKISIFIHKVLEKKQNLMDVFSCLPCSWYFYIFVKAVTVTLTLQEGFVSRYVLINMATFAEFLTLIALLVYVMFKVEALLSESNRRLEVLSAKALLQRKTQHWLQVQNDIVQANKFEYVAFDLFSMNKSFMLGFTSSLLTFTVLFVQVINQIEKTSFHETE